MKKPHEDYGEFRAYQAGIEAPTCWICDEPISLLSELRHTTRGYPLCADCANGIDHRVNAHIAGLPAALQAILNDRRPDAHL